MTTLWRLRGFTMSALTSLAMTAMAAALPGACTSQPASPMVSATVVPAAPPALPTPPRPTDHAALAQALLEGRDTARACQSQIDDDTYEFVGCVQARLRAIGDGAEDTDDARRLGVLAWGWYTAWIHGAYSIDGADQTSAQLMRQLLPLQQRLALSAAQLCSLTDAPCPLVAEARRETLARLQSESP